MADVEKLAAFGASLDPLADAGARIAAALSAPVDPVKLADFVAEIAGDRLGDLIVQLNLIQIERRRA